MRPRYAFAAFFLMFAPTLAHAQDVEVDVSLKSRYIDAETFNDVFSNSPSLQVEASSDLSKHVSVSGYVYTGFKKPFNDDSSEYGAEINGHWDVGTHTQVGIAGGRYANYAGEGFHTGDWYAKATVIYKEHLTLSASVLHGASNTGLIGVSYELPVTDKLTLKASVAYFTRNGKLNPALTAEYQLTKKLSVGATFVYPKDDRTGSRKAYAGVSVTATF